MSADKVIVTNLAKLEEKYGAPAMPVLQQAVDALIAADAARGLTTVLVDLSDATEMKKYKAATISATKATDPGANKRAIDKVFKAIRPAYLMLLGSIDVIPHQDLKNPLYSPDEDTDEFAFSDLPYACDAAYSQDIADFLAPTRVVGRLPDVTGGKDVNYLVGLLQTAANYKEGPVANYDAFLGITAKVWQSSTDTSLRAIFGNATDMKISPSDGPVWSDSELKPRVRFINCHGAPADWRFYGQKGDNFPTAHDASLLDGRITEGTIAAAECCYGAELYDPALTDGQLGLCNTYLANKAYAFFGSSTIAYGPAAGNALADLICQYFLIHVRDATSIGRACLQARLDYLQQASTLTGTDLKTLAQFNLLGDPALTPVQSAQPAPHVLPTGAKAKKGISALEAVAKTTRFLRRATLHEIAKTVATTVYKVAAKASKPASAKKFMADIKKEAKKLGINDPTVLSFVVEKPSLPKTMAAAAKSASLAAPKVVHNLMERIPVAGEGANVINIHGVEVIQYEGTMEMRPFFSR